MTNTTASHLRALSNESALSSGAALFRPSGYIAKIAAEDMQTLLFSLNVTAESFDKRLEPAAIYDRDSLFSNEGISLDDEQFFPLINDESGQVAVLRELEPGDVSFERIFLPDDRSVLIDLVGEHRDVIGYCENLASNASEAWLAWPNTAVGWCKNIIDEKPVGTHPRILRPTAEGAEPTQQDLERGLVLHQRGRSASSPWMPRPTRVYLALANFTRIDRLDKGERTLYQTDGTQQDIDTLCQGIIERAIALVKEAIANNTVSDIQSDGVIAPAPKGNATTIAMAFSALGGLFQQSAVSWCRSNEAIKAIEAEQTKDKGSVPGSDDNQEDGGLSGGAIAGIVIGSLAVCCCCLFTMGAGGGY